MYRNWMRLFVILLFSDYNQQQKMPLKNMELKRNTYEICQRKKMKETKKKWVILTVLCQVACCAP